MSVFDVMGEEDFDGIETMESLAVETFLRCPYLVSVSEWDGATYAYPGSQDDIDRNPSQYGTREYADERGYRW